MVKIFHTVKRGFSVVRRSASRRIPLFSQRASVYRIGGPVVETLVGPPHVVSVQRRASRGHLYILTDH